MATTTAAVLEIDARQTELVDAIRGELRQAQIYDDKPLQHVLGRLLEAGQLKSCQVASELVERDLVGTQSDGLEVFLDACRLVQRHQR